MTPKMALEQFESLSRVQETRGTNDLYKTHISLRWDQVECMDEMKKKQGWSVSAQMRAAVDLWLESHGYTGGLESDCEARSKPNGHKNSRNY